MNIIYIQIKKKFKYIISYDANFLLQLNKKEIKKNYRDKILSDYYN